MEWKEVKDNTKSLSDDEKQHLEDLAVQGRDIEIHGVITIHPTMTYDDWYDKFIDWVEENGWMFGGSTEDISETEEENNDLPDMQVEKGV